MRRFSLYITAILCILFVSCTNYQEQIDKIQRKIDVLSTNCESLNTTAAALSQLVKAADTDRRVVSFVLIAASDGTPVGFKIYFHDEGNVTLYNTFCSVVPVKDGDTYYWKDGKNWITDADGNRIAISYETAPLQFKDDNNSLWYSCDGGKTWQKAGEKANYLIRNVTETADAVTFTLFDNSLVTLSKLKEGAFSIKIGTIPESITSESTVEIPYKLMGDTEGVYVHAAAPQGWTATINPTSHTTGIVKITPPEEIYEAEITVVASNDSGKAVATNIRFNEYIQTEKPDQPDQPDQPDEPDEPDVFSVAYDTYYAESSDSQIDVQVTTNLTYTVEVDNSAKDWIIPVTGTKAIRVDVIPFRIKANNTGSERSGRVTFTSGIYTTSVQFVQEAPYVMQTWQPIKFRTSSSYRNQLTIKYDGDVATIVTTGTDPYISTNTLTESLPEDAKVLTFEYTSTKRIDDLQIFFRPPLAESNSTHEGALPATSSWKEVSFPINIERLTFSNWGAQGDFLRMDFGNNKDITIQVRNIHFRNATSAELKEMKKTEEAYSAKTFTNQNIKEYLKHDFMSEVTDVEVQEEQIIVRGHCNGSDTYYLAEIPAYEIAADMESFEYKTPIHERDFTITLDRYAEHQGIDADRLLSSWAIIKKNGNEETLASHARYADSFPCESTPPAPVYKTQKGLAGYFGQGLQTSDLDELQASSVTVNIPINHYMSKTSTTYYNDYCGKRYYFSNITELDNILRQCYSRKIVVSAIILIQRTKTILEHPECNGGNYSMPNMTTQESINAYAAILDYMARRYSKPDGRYGLIHNWIMHNEVDMATTWTNMGNQPLYRYMDAYMHSMRICHNIARCYNEHAQILGSFTNSWTNNLEYAPKDMLDIILKYSEREGDFQWGVAYHPYPQSIANPKTWNDGSAQYDMSTAYVSFKNLEVLDKWIKMPEHMYRHTVKRTLWLSENGANTPSYSDTDLKNQAACAAWALYKVSHLDGIDAITWHNWCDNASEGLNLGLRKSPEAGYEAKPSYYVYKAGMTDSWETAFNPYLSVIGISSWPSIMHTVK